MLAPTLGVGNVEPTLVQFKLQLREVKSPAQVGGAKNEPGFAQPQSPNSKSGFCCSLQDTPQLEIN